MIKDVDVLEPELRSVQPVAPGDNLAAALHRIMEGVMILRRLLPRVPTDLQEEDILKLSESGAFDRCKDALDHRQRCWKQLEAEMGAVNDEVVKRYGSILTPEMLSVFERPKSRTGAQAAER